MTPEVSLPVAATIEIFMEPVRLRDLVEYDARQS